LTSDKLKILVLADSRSFHVERYVRELVRQNCRVVTASLERGQLTHYHLKKRGPFKLWHYLFSVYEIKHLIKKFQPDIVNPHFASGYGYTAALAVSGKKLPVVLVLWGSDVLIVPDKSYFHKRKTQKALKRADFVFGDSNYLISRAEKMTSLKQSRVIPWGIEEKYFKYYQFDYKLQKPLKIIIPRMHEKVYNNLFIVKTLAPLIKKNRVRLTFPTFGSLAEEFKKHSKEIVGERLEFYDKMNRDSFLKFMSGFDVYLSASKSDSSPVSLIEAMALGLIPVTADIPGVKEWLTPANGYLFKENDSEGLPAILEKIITDNDPHERIRRDNFERVKREAVFEKNVAEQITVMKELAGKKYA